MGGDLPGIIAELKSKAEPGNVRGMMRFGINTKGALGISIVELRKMARRIGKDHDLAQDLWKSGIHEARILASIVDTPSALTERQMESWANDFDSWDVCDQVCSNLFSRSSLAWRKAGQWARRDEEFVRRAGFVLMAALAVHDKGSPDSRFVRFFPLISAGCVDERNFVRKAVNWSLRQIGKRSLELNRRAVSEAERMLALDSKAARWVAGDALRELTGKAVQARLRRKGRN